MSLFGSGIQNQIYGYGLNPGLVPLIAIACVPCILIIDISPTLSLLSEYPSITLSQKWALIDLDSKVPLLDLEECDCG